MSGVVLKSIDGDSVFDVPKGKTTIGRGPYLQVISQFLSRIKLWQWLLLLVHSLCIFSVVAKHTGNGWFRPDYVFALGGFAPVTCSP